jgi:hypothetical protein
MTSQQVTDNAGAKPKWGPVLSPMPMSPLTQAQAWVPQATESMRRLLATPNCWPKSALAEYKSTATALSTQFRESSAGKIIA